jgi:hypothetical protein
MLREILCSLRWILFELQSWLPILFRRSTKGYAGQLTLVFAPPRTKAILSEFRELVKGLQTPSRPTSIGQHSPMRAATRTAALLAAFVHAADLEL